MTFLLVVVAVLIPVCFECCCLYHVVVHHSMSWLIYLVCVQDNNDDALNDVSGGCLFEKWVKESGRKVEMK